MAQLRLTEDGELTVFTSAGNHIGRIDLSDPVTLEAMRLALGAPVEEPEPDGS